MKFGNDYKQKTHQVFTGFTSGSYENSCIRAHCKVGEKQL